MRPEPAPRVPASRGGGAGEATILIVEDDRALRELLAAALTASGYQVLAAADGGEALRLAEAYRARIALLVSDLMMPGMDGLDLARRLAARRAGLKVLLLSGYPRDPGGLDPRMAFLQKPFRPQALAARVRELLQAPAGASG